MEFESSDVLTESPKVGEFIQQKLSPLASPTNFQAISTIYRRSRNKAYSRIAHSHSPVTLEPVRINSFDSRESPSPALGSNEVAERHNTNRSPKPSEIGPSINSPSSFYFYKRRDRSREKIRKFRSDEAKHNKNRHVELIPVKHDHRTTPKSIDISFLKVKSKGSNDDFRSPKGAGFLDKPHKTHKDESLANKRFSLPPVQRKAEYSSKIQKILNDCDKIPDHWDMTKRVNIEQQAVAQITRQLEWTTDALSRIQDSEAHMLEPLFSNLEAEKLNSFQDLSEVKRYFKFFSNNPSKQLRMVGKVLRRRKNRLL